MADITEALGGQRLPLLEGPVLLALQLGTSGQGGLGSPKDPQNGPSGLAAPSKGQRQIMTK